MAISYSSIHSVITGICRMSIHFLITGISGATVRLSPAAISVDTTHSLALVISALTDLIDFFLFSSEFPESLSEAN